MSDQPISNQPTLSPEEELDILEAVYKIGKEKGLDLLRPEQVRKLMVAGRIGAIKGSETGLPGSRGSKLPNMEFIIDGVMYGLLEKCKNDCLMVARETNYEPTEADLTGIVWDKFTFDYGVDPTTFKEMLVRSCYRKGNHAS